MDKTQHEHGDTPFFRNLGHKMARTCLLKNLYHLYSKKIQSKCIDVCLKDLTKCILHSKVTIIVIYVFLVYLTSILCMSNTFIALTSVR